MNFKFGVLYATAGQAGDDEMFSNSEFRFCLYSRFSYCYYNYIATKYTVLAVFFSEIFLLFCINSCFDDVFVAFESSRLSVKSNHTMLKVERTPTYNLTTWLTCEIKMKESK